MFNFSLKILNTFFSKELPENAIRISLGIRGFEVLSQRFIQDDIVYKIDVRNNRPDMLCYIGVAREISLHLGVELNLHQAWHSDMEFPYNFYVEQDVCKDICASVIDVDKELAEGSFPNLEYVLDVAGQKKGTAIENIENYCSILFGQIVSIIDTNIIRGKDIFIRKLQYIEQPLFCEDMIAICDNEKIIATPCFNNLLTREIKGKLLVISACYDKILIRKAEKKIKTITATSYIASRGTIPYMGPNYLDSILLKMGTVTAKTFIGAKREERIAVSIKKLCSLIGNDYTAVQIKEVFDKYHIKTAIVNDEKVIVSVPEYRIDLRSEVEIIEEFARLIGYENIIPQIPTLKLEYRRSPLYECIKHTKRAAIMLGLNECLGHMLTGSNYNDLLRLSPQDELYSNVRLANPVTKRQSLCATTLVINLLEKAKKVYSNGQHNIRLFEVTKVCKKHIEGEKYTDEFHIGILISGIKTTKQFGVPEDIPYHFFDIFELLESIMSHYAIQYTLEPRNIPFLCEGSACQIKNRSSTLGFLGEINVELVKDIMGRQVKDSVYYFECNLECFSDKNFKIFPDKQEKTVVRDYNFLFNNNQTLSKLFFIARSFNSHIKELKVKDIYYVDNDCRAILVSMTFAIFDGESDIRGVEKEMLERMEREGIVLRC